MRGYHTALQATSLETNVANAKVHDDKINLLTNARKAKQTGFENK